MGSYFPDQEYLVSPALGCAESYPLDHQTVSMVEFLKIVHLQILVRGNKSVGKFTTVVKCNTSNNRCSQI